MNLKRIIFFVVFISSIFLININNTFALENKKISKETYDYIIKNTDPSELDATLDKYLNGNFNDEIINTNSMYATANFSYKLSVPNYRQETSYWCGPANIKQVLQYINGSSLSQATYASSMGTNSTDGTYVYKMRDELNNRQSRESYVYSLMGSGGYSFDSFLNFHSFALTKSAPLIYHIKTHTLYMYNGTSLGHYLTGSGYSYTEIPGSTPLRMITYVDTYYADYGRGSVLGTFTAAAENVYAGLNGRYLIW
jgi:hypothetical protein